MWVVKVRMMDFHAQLKYATPKLELLTKELEEFEPSLMELKATVEQPRNDMKNLDFRMMEQEQKITDKGLMIIRLKKENQG
jgi:chromosome segregation ATPase